MKHSNLHFSLIFSLLLVLISSSCKKEEQHPIPNVYVNFTINLQTDPEFYRLRTQGTSVVIVTSPYGLPVGYNDNGIIIYNDGDGEFYAFDRTCPYDIPESIIVETDNLSAFATCPQCGSVYVFSSMGNPTLDSPARWPLKTYHAIYNPNSGQLQVSN